MKSYTVPIAVYDLALTSVYGTGTFSSAFEFAKRMDDGRPFILIEAERARRIVAGYVETAAAIALAVMDGRAGGESTCW